MNHGGVADPDLLGPGLVYPAYQKAALSDLLPSVIDGLGLPGSYDILGLGDLNRVLILLIDGMGVEQIERYSDEVPVLAAALERSLTSVFPSTTAAALTSLGTGLPPGAHGIVGAAFRLEAGGRILHPLQWRDHPPVPSVQPEPTLWRLAAERGVQVRMVGPRAYARTGLSGAALGGAPYVGADGPGERAAAMAAGLAGPGRRLVYGYWEWLDKTAHINGVDSAAYVADLRQVEYHINEILRLLPSGTTMLVTADHGVVDCPDVVDLDSLLDPQVRLLAGEPRMRHLYTAPGTAEDVLGRLRERLGEAAVVLTKEQAVLGGLFGPVAADVEERIGDLIVIASGRTRLASESRDSIVSSLRGQHGSLTPEEMTIPLMRWDL